MLTQIRLLGVVAPIRTNYAMGLTTIQPLRSTSITRTIHYATNSYRPSIIRPSIVTPVSRPTPVITWLSTRPFTHASSQLASVILPTPKSTSSKSPASSSSTQYHLPAPRLVYAFPDVMNWKRLSIVNGVQTIFWIATYAASFKVPEIPHWAGAVGLSMALAFGLLIQLRAKRTITEVAVYPGAGKLRFKSSDFLSRPVYQDVLFSDIIGTNITARKNTGALTHPVKAPSFWSIQLSGTNTYHSLDTNGIIYDVDTFNKMLGGDVELTFPINEAHKIRIMQPTEEETKSRNSHFKPRN